MMISRSSLERWIAFSAAIALGIAPAPAGEADVINVIAALNQDGSFRFDVTIAHADSGWEHYADRFEILAAGDVILGARVLLHPHETEQPVTRSLARVDIPQGISTITARAHDLVHEYGGAEVSVDLTALR